MVQYAASWRRAFRTFCAFGRKNSSSGGANGTGAVSPPPTGGISGGNGNVIGGGTLGCSHQAVGSSFLFGAEAEAGVMRLHAYAVDPYSVPPLNVPNPNYLADNTFVGDWYGAVAARAGWAYQRALFYGKVGAGITDVKSSIVTPCDLGPCGPVPGRLNATFSATRVFWVGGGGIEWAWTGNWTVKMEYLYLGLNETDAVCGPSTPSGLNYCSSHTLRGIHSTKLGLNYKLY